MDPFDHSSNPNTMKVQCVGVDIAKNDFKVAFATKGEDNKLSCTTAKKFDNAKTGFNQLVRWATSEMDKNAPLVFLMEATGVYHEKLAHHLHRAGKQVHVVLPNKFKHFAASLNSKSKTDAIDAKLLARFGVEREHRPWNPAELVIKRMRDFSRYRYSYKNRRRPSPTSFIARIMRMVYQRISRRAARRSLPCWKRKSRYSVRKWRKW
ncbi:MAG: transposase [Flavobacteriales bacterium]|nr:transposase [Flavobacteriales bacterium]